MTDPARERAAIAIFEQSLDVEPDARRDWAAQKVKDDPELLARVHAMIDADHRAALRTGGAVYDLQEEEAPDHVGQYRIVRRIGRGGMGSVYLGERDSGDFSHIVAIKLIKPGLLSRSLIERFLREREILASLKHPNIAQLYDGGETGNGSPYIVMEYIDGLPLLQWVDEADASIATRVALFRDICAAVAFAHRNLVVHRDLTPSNVLVTRDGTAKLIDFGISKPAVPDALGADVPHASSIGSLSLTPGYAAPERMTGSAITTYADIYSLGKLLMRLMPAQGVARRADLHAVIARATADKPGDRYATVEALSDDVLAWHQGYAVEPLRHDRKYVLSRFISRNRWSVGLGSIAAMLLSVAVAATLMANVRAEHERAEADRRFQQTRAIAKTMLFEVFDSVSQVPGSTKAREMLATKGVDYLDALANDHDAPIDVKVEAGLGFVRLAEVVGGGQAGQLGRYEDSGALLARAGEILAGPWATDPDNPMVQKAYCEWLLEQTGTDLYNNNKPKEAREKALKIQSILKDVATRDPTSARIYATAIQAEGDSYGWDADYAKARVAHGRAEAFLTALSPALQKDVGVMSTRSANLRLLGEAHHKVKENDAARKALDAAVDVNLQLVADNPDNPALLRKLAISQWYRAVVHRTNERHALASASISDAVANAEKLRMRDPADMGALQMVAITGEVQAQVLADAGRYRESFATGDKVIAAHRKMVDAAGNKPGAMRSLAAALRTQGGNHYNGGDYAGACRIWRETLQIYRNLEIRGVLTETDREVGYAEMKRVIPASCEGGPPRAGAGRTI